MKKIFYLIFLISFTAFGQSNNPDSILTHVINNFSNVKSYIVNVKIKVDVSFLKIPDTEAKIYFKQPDKIHFESKNFALLPKEGVDFSPLGLLEKKYTAIFQRNEEYKGINTAVIKVIPLEENSKVILSTFWIDTKLNEIRKVESTTRLDGTFSIELEYDNNLKYPLPSQMVFSFNIEKMNLPQGFDGDITQDEKKNEKKKSTTGKVIVNYFDYQVNVNIPDSIFAEKKKTVK